MRNIWTIIKILAPATIAFLISLYLDNESQIVATLFIGVVASIIQFLKNNTVINTTKRNRQELKGLISNQKQKLHSHTNEPHIIASATIRINSTVTIESGFNITSVTDMGANEIRLNIDNPSGKNIIPSINTNAKKHVSVTATPSTIIVSWDQSCPNVIYMTAVHAQ